ncbi:MAG: TerB family tellurite resistance protein [Saprospiraceae bacterium]|nr:TerB family tellurite resistance protein [Saprospiraceae bacterium]MCC7504304.1 TerB family tellurite resistance protein [Saprospiraceae bacterium]
MQVSDWTYEEFHAFTLLYAANTDGSVTPDEEALIAPTLPAESYAKIREAFFNASDAETLDIILSFKGKYCSTPADKERILADMRAVFEAHHGLEQIEREMLHMFDRLMC